MRLTGVDGISGRRSVATGDDGRRQIITLAVDTPRSRDEARLLSVLVGATKGVDAVDTDPVRSRLWAFANGTVDPEALCDALGSWGYGAYVLENRFSVPV